MSAFIFFASFIILLTLVINSPVRSCLSRRYPDRDVTTFSFVTSFFLSIPLLIASLLIYLVLFY